MKKRTVLITVTGGVESDFDAQSYFHNELSNHGIDATIVPATQLTTLLRDALRLMPLGTKERAEWLARATDAVAELH